MKRNTGKIALSPAQSALERIKATGPPNVSIENARKILGPALYRLIRQGWLDEDIIAELSDGQDESDLRHLLIEARREERRARREREKARAKTTADRISRDVQRPSGLIAHQSGGQGVGAAPMLAAPSPPPSLALPAPPTQLAREGPPDPTYPADGPPTGTPHPITRNRGIQRP